MIYPSIDNQNGFYSFYFLDSVEFSSAELQLIEKVKESQRGYLDEKDLMNFHFGKRLDNTRKFTLNILQSNKLLQFDLSWKVNYDLIDNLLIRVYHLIERYMDNPLVVNLESLKTFFLANNFKVYGYKEVDLPNIDEYQVLFAEAINIHTNYSNSFIYHFVPNKGVCFEKFPNSLDRLRRIDKDFKDFQNRTKLLRYLKLEKEELFVDTEPTEFIFERKRFLR